MTAPRVVVVGSSNTDMVVLSQTLPRPGETVLGGRFVQAAGGKGANQAVAAARAGADVTLIANVGRDPFGDAAVAGLQAEGVNTRYVTRDPSLPSGVALILVDARGENLISVAPGANATLSPAHLDAARDAIAEADILLLQLEIPLPTVAHATRLAKDSGVPVLLNPAPAPHDGLDPAIWQGVSYLTPNRTEIAQLAQVEPDAEPLERLAIRLLRTHQLGAVVVTLGAQGSLVVTPEDATMVPSFPVTPIDTVGAGDCFSACLAVAMAEGQSLPDAVRFATAAAALSTTREGAQPSMPRRPEILSLLSQRQ